MGMISKERTLKTADNSLGSIFETPKTTGVFISIILFISLAVYSNTLFNGFVYDDDKSVLENHWIKDIKNIPAIFSKSIWSFAEKSLNFYRPLIHIIYMFNYHLFGLVPWGFHLINMLFHAGVSILVFIITKKLLRESLTPASSLSAFIATLLFATHPVHTEAVAWAAAISDLSYTLFFLLAFYHYMRAREGVRRAYLFSVASFALATLCKEPALTFPIFLIAYDYVYMKEGDRFPNCIRRYIPYLIVSVCYLLMRSYALEGFSRLKPDIQLTGYGYFINIFPLFSRYLEKLLLPINLNAIYVFHPISSIFEIRGVVSAAITAAFIFFSLIALKKNKTVFIGCLLIVVPLLPALYMYPSLGNTSFSERYLYLPSFGFVILIASFLSWTQANKPRLSLSLNIITILVTGLYSFGTISRNTVWKDNYTLFSDTVKKSPDSPLVRNNLGLAYAAQGRLADAANEYQTALKLDPADIKAHNNLGIVYRAQGRADEAINEYQIVLKLDPGHVTAHNNLANIYLKQGRIAEAIYEYQIALKLKPDYVDAHYNLGVAYKTQGRVAEALNEFQTALKIKPDFAAARRNLELLLGK